MNCVSAGRSAVMVFALAVIPGLTALGAAPAAVDPKPQGSAFGPSNPFFAPSTLPFQAPPFDRIRDEDYRPAIEAGMAAQRAEVAAIADSKARPTIDNTLLALEKSGSLLARAELAFNAVSGANIDPTLQAAKTALAPELAAHEDAIHLNSRLFARVRSLYDRRGALHLDPETLRLLEVIHAEFVHAGANLNAADKARLERLNAEASTLSDAFTTKLLAATKDAAYHTTSAAALAGLSDQGLAAAAQAARARQLEGYLIPLQNTTQQPALASLDDRATRQALFENSWGRTERGDANDTRATIARLARLRAERASLLGFANHAAWKLEDQMAKTPAAAENFMADLVPLSTAKALSDRASLQTLLGAAVPGATLAAWDWEYYDERARRARFDLDESLIKPYFELDNVLENGVFYAANQLYGIGFKERKDIPVYHPDVRVFEVTDADGKPLALFYCDYFKRDNKNGGAWMSSLVRESKLQGTLPVVYNVANLPKPAPGDPALISFDDVRTMFHEFGHALHGMFADTRYPDLSGTATARDFVEFPSQFNEHWASYPAVFEHYARHYQTGAPMPPDLAAKLKSAEWFDEGYALTELLAAAEIDMHWHTLPASAPLQDPDVLEKQALVGSHLDVDAVPPRYRSSYFSHIWASGYSAGYYAYLWTQMLDDDAYAWFEEHGGLTRANGERFRRMVLSRGNTTDLAELYAAWRGRPPTVDAMLRYRGLTTAPGN
jgi:peptidyl-dipeptidase Dcp